MDMELVKSVVKEPIGYDTDECAIYKAEHSNCGGCEFELGCGKSVAIGLIMLRGSLYRPKDFNDSLARDKRVAELVNKIAKAKTPDEVKSLV